MSKKLISLLLAICILFCLSACGTTETSGNTTNTPSESQTEIMKDNDKNTFGEENSQLSSAAEETNENDSSQTPTQTNQSKPTSNTNQSAHTHNYSSSVTKEATCGNEGVRTYKCSCGNSYTESINKTSSHNWEYATCSKPDTCKNCGTTRGVAKGHSYNYDAKCSCGAINPEVAQKLAKCSLSIPSFPKSVSYYGYDKKLHSTVLITNIAYKFNCNNNGQISLELSFSGTKTYDYEGVSHNGVCVIDWKLYGPDGSIVESKTFHSPSIAEGESFTNKTQYAFVVSDFPAGNYRLEINDLRN